MPPPLIKSEQASYALPVDHEDSEYDIEPDDDDDIDEEDHEEESHFSASIKYLLAGGVAGAGKFGLFTQ